MLKSWQMKQASRRVRNVAANRAGRRTTRQMTRRERFIDAICHPFRTIGRGLRAAWRWICAINVVGLVNTTLLVAIIVLFSMLIIDFVRAYRQPKISLAIDAPAATQTADRPAVINTQEIETPALPLRREEKSGKYVGKPIQVVKPSVPAVVERQTPRANGKIYGDLVIDNRDAGAILQNGSHVQGNVYLQNMRKYILPCDIRIDGNLFLRDLGMLQFCGDFIITGNIYVSPRSSFGPIPGTARLGGQVIL